MQVSELSFGWALSESPLIHRVEARASCNNSAARYFVCESADKAIAPHADLLLEIVPGGRTYCRPASFSYGPCDGTSAETRAYWTCERPIEYATAKLVLNACDLFARYHLAHRACERRFALAGYWGRSFTTIPDQSKTLLDMRIESAREIRRALATPIPGPEPLAPIRAKPAYALGGPTKIASTPRHKLSRERGRRSPQNSDHHRRYPLTIANQLCLWSVPMTGTRPITEIENAEVAMVALACAYQGARAAEECMPRQGRSIPGCQ